MAESLAPHGDSHLSIGEVLGLLLEEFPDVTISKIRFLESQGLISPERTSSGYRKFRDPDVELLRCILREQRENFLPLRVIKDRIDSGEIDPTNEQVRPDPAVAEVPRGIRNVEVRTAATRPADAATPTEHQRAAGELTADELCGSAGITRHQLDELLAYGVVTTDRSGMFGADALAIVVAARQLLAAGIDARHLRGWRVSADREVSLYEQLVNPIVRQRNPEARVRAAQLLADLESAGAALRSALVRSASDRLTPS